MSIRKPFFVGLVGFGIALPLALCVWLYGEAALSDKPVLMENLAFSQAIYARDGEMLSLQLSQDGLFRLPISPRALPEKVVDATLYYEDRYFWKHSGVNPVSLVRAAWSTLTGKRQIGASTITMQLVRRLEGLETRTLEGKFRQIRSALAYEAHYSKEEILAAYLTLAPYGGNVEGIEAAAQLYFGKPAATLSTREAMALAVVPQNPVKRHPVSGQAFEKARLAFARRALDEGHVPARIAPALLAPMNIASRHIPFEAPHYTRAITEGKFDVTTIETGLSLPLNRAVQKILHEAVERSHAFGIGNAAAMVLDVRTMEILAYVGSADFFDDKIGGQVDGITAPRSPGSTLKPFIYALGIDQGDIHNRSILMDAPSNFAGYEPLNEDRRYQGPIDATNALNRSRNIPAIGLELKLKPDLYDFITGGLNVKLPYARDWYGLSIVLGSAEIPMLKLVSAYATLLNQGVYSTPLWTKDSTQLKRPLFSPEAAAIVRDMLKEGGETVTVRGSDLPLAWKTGTSNGYHDAWTIGFAGPYVVAVWSGNFSGRPAERLRGATIALPLWKEVAMRTLTEKTLSFQEKDPERRQEAPVWDAMPSTLSLQDVCRRTGDLAVDNFGNIRCHDTVKAWFIPGKTSIAPSGYLKKIRIDPKTGFRTCPGFRGPTQIKYVEQWPQKWREIMTSNGLRPMPLPPLHPSCSGGVSSADAAPRMILPEKRRVYQVDPASNIVEIELSAETSPEHPESLLYWFYQGVWLGSTRSGEKLRWNTDPGEKVITVTDEHGHTASRTVSVKR